MLNVFARAGKKPFLVRKIHVLQYNVSRGRESFFTFFTVPKYFAPSLLYQAISTVLTYTVNKVIP